MKSNSKLVFTVALMMSLCAGEPVWAQTGAFRKMAVELVEQIMKKGGKEAAEELARVGGEKAAEELLEKAAREGGQAVAEKLARDATEYGVVILKGAQKSPAKFVRALEDLAPELRAGALQAVRREPELVSGLISEFGKEGLEVAAKHPGVGGSLLKNLGREALPVVKNLSRDEGIQFARLSKDIAAMPQPQRSGLLEMLARAPSKVLKVLNENPRVLYTAAALTAFLAAKDQIIGSQDPQIVIGPDGVPVVVSKLGLLDRFLAMFRKPLTAILGILGLAITGWACIRLWATYRLSRLRILAAEARATREMQEKHKA